MSQSHLSKIAIVGASGNVGAPLLKHLLEVNKHIHVTIISRQDSNAEFPSSSQITVRKGSYDDAAFLKDAFAGNELALFALGFMAMGVQEKLIDAAVQAGVKWVVPNEYANDGLNKEMCDAVPIFQGKVQARQQIDQLAQKHEGVKWIGIATNPWTDYCIKMGAFHINPQTRTATLYTGTGPFNSTSNERVGEGIAKLLSLPLTASNPRESLSHYANNFVYLSSFSITQQQILESLQRATGTSDADWTIQRPAIKDLIDGSRAKMAAGDRMAAMGLVFAYYMGEGLGGDYQTKALEDLKVLGLEEEKLDDVVKRVVSAAA